MSRLTGHRGMVAALRAAAVAPVAVGAVLLPGPAGASADPGAESRPQPAAAGPAGVAIIPRTTTLPFKHASAERSADQDRIRAAAPAAVPQLPVWSSSFRYASHATYPYTMVGTDPAGPPATTTVDDTLTPVALRFSGNTVVAPSAALIRQLGLTGLYTRQAFPGGRGQYGDVYLRTQFWSALDGGRKNWHLLLAPPARQRVLSLTVPPAKGGPVRTKTGATVWLVDVGWFDDQLLDSVTAARPSALTQFLGGNVLLCGRYEPRNPGSCGIGGYHSGVDAADGAHTYAYASFLPSKALGTRSGFYGLAPLSHEIAEWLTDPLLTNAVPAWTEPSVPQYGCSTVLEVGDPLVGHILTVAGSAYQDEAYLPYFTRGTAPATWNRRYTWFGTFTTYSGGCTPPS